MAADVSSTVPSWFVGPLPQDVLSPHELSSSPGVARIVNGTLTSQFPSVGLIGDNTGYFCSGTLIAPRYVLTAAHCADGVPQTAGRFKLGNSIYNTTQVFVHPGYNENLIGSDSANDIAIYKLDRDVVGVTPSPIYRSVPQVGQLLTLVGFGAGGTGTSGHDGTFGTKRMGTTPIDGVSSRLIHWDFDHNSESNTAPGDSGGPAFLNVNGVYVVAGVTSGGDQANAGLGDHSFDTRVDAYAGWIDSIVGGPPASTVVSIQALDATAAETLAGQAANLSSFQVSRTGSITSPLIVNLNRGGTATNGVDYSALPATVTIPAGAAAATVVMTPRDDTALEGTETVILSLAAGNGYQIDSTKSTTTLTLLDNETVTSNDMFVHRRPISGALATVTGSNTGATRESGEPNVLGVSGGKSVWWTWTAAVNGTVTFSTAGSNFDTTLGVYKGSVVNSLALVKANDDQNLSQGILTSRLSFSAVAGQTYQILVDGYEGAAGSIVLKVDQPNGRSFGGRKILSKLDGPQAAGSPAEFLAGESGERSSARFSASGREGVMPRSHRVPLLGNLARPQPVFGTESNFRGAAGQRFACDALFAEQGAEWASELTCELAPGV